MRLGARPTEGAPGPRSGLPAASPEPRPRARARRLPRLHSKRMNQPRPGARPPRFLFSFSTPRAAGAARLHRRGFPGTLPLTPLGVPVPSSAPLLRKDSEVPQPARAPCRPSPQPLPQPPRRLAVALPPRSPAPLALKPSRGGAGSTECDCGAAVGLCEGSGGKPGVERPPPARRPGSRGRRGSGGSWRARARPRTCPTGTPSAPRSRCWSPSPRLQSLMVSTSSCSLGGFAREPGGRHKQGYLDPEQPFRKVWVLGFLRLRFWGV